MTDDREVVYSADYQKLIAASREASDILAQVTDRSVELGGDFSDLEKRARGVDSAINNLVKKLEKANQTLRNGKSATGSYADGFGDIVKQVQAATKAVKTELQTGVANSGVDVGTGQNMSLQQARAVLSVEKAMSETAISRARTIVRAEEQRLRLIQRAAQAEARAAAQAAQVEAARSARSIQQSQGRISSTLATRNVNDDIRQYGDIAAAQNRVAKASQEVAKAQAGIRNNSSEINAQARAWRNLADAEEEATRAARQLDMAQEAAMDGLASQRYALYDIAATYGVVGAAILGATGYAVTLGAQYESAFTTVQRVTGAAGDQFGPVGTQARDLKDELIGLSTQIPVTFEELSTLAARGAQIGVANEELVSFSETMAKFIAVAETADPAAIVEQFGRLSQITGVKNYEALASAVLELDNAASATEGQILATTQYITQSADAAGFAADEILALSTTLISLGTVQPQGARAGIQGLFQVLDRAIAGVNDKLPAFARLMGISEQEVARLRNDDTSAFLVQLVASLEATGAQSSDLIGILDGLGLKSNEVTNFFQGLVGQSQFLAQNFGVSSAAFQEQSRLAQDYTLVLDDLNSQWAILLNTLNALVVGVGSGATPALAELLVIVNGVLREFSTWLGQNEWAGQIIAIAGGVTVLIGVMATLRATTAIVRGSVLAYTLIQYQASRAQVATTGSSFGLIASMFGVRNATIAAAQGATVARRAFILLGAAARSVLAVLAIATVVGNLEGFIGGANKATKQVGGLGKKVAEMQDPMAKYNEAMRNAQDSAGGAGGAAEDLGNKAGGAGKQVEELAEKVRTLTDYASDLSGVFSRSFELRFGNQQSEDKIAKSWINIRESIADANLEIQKIRASMLQLQGVKGEQTFFLSVAEFYEDDIRAATLRGDLAETDAKLAEENKKLQEQQKKTNKTLDGGTETAIDNRTEILGLVGSYQDLIKQYASSGMSQDELRAKVRQLREQFIQQGTSMGYSRAELEGYAVAFDDFGTIVDNVPRDVTVAFNANPALQALAEFQAKLDETKRDAESAAGGVNDALGGIGGGAGTGGLEDWLQEYQDALNQGLGDDLVVEDQPDFWDKVLKSWGDLSIASDIANLLNGDLAKVDWVRLISFALFPATGGLFNSNVADWFNRNVIGTLSFIFRNLPALLGDTSSLLIRAILGQDVSQEVSQWSEKFTSGLTAEQEAFGAAGRQLGTDVSSGFTGVEPDTSGWTESKILTKLRDKQARAGQEGAGLGAKVGSGFREQNPDAGRWADNNIITAVGSRSEAARRTGGGLGARVGEGLTSQRPDVGGWTERDLLNKVSDKNDIARTKGGGLGGSILSGMRGALSAGWSTVSSLFNSLFNGLNFSSGTPAKGKGWASGGYTGPGGKYDVAGQVHRGEYVFPKYAVDQRSGLPKMDYMMQLHSGRPAFKSSGGYATGGHVSGGGGQGYAMIDPRQVRQIVNATLAAKTATIAATPQQWSGQSDRGRFQGSRRGSQR